MSGNNLMAILEELEARLRNEVMASLQAAKAYFDQQGGSIDDQFKEDLYEIFNESVDAAYKRFMREQRYAGNNEKNRMNLNSNDNSIKRTSAGRIRSVAEPNCSSHLEPHEASADSTVLISDSDDEIDSHEQTEVKMEINEIYSEESSDDDYTPIVVIPVAQQNETETNETLMDASANAGTSTDEGSHNASNAEDVEYSNENKQGRSGNINYSSFDNAVPQNAANNDKQIQKPQTGIIHEKPVPRHNYGVIRRRISSAILREVGYFKEMQTLEKPQYKCKRCDNIYSTKYSLRSHQLKHKNEMVGLKKIKEKLDKTFEEKGL